MSKAGFSEEHDDLDLRLVTGEQRHFGIVGGKADVPDLARSQKFAHVFDEGAVHDGAELVAGVHVVDHASSTWLGAQRASKSSKAGRTWFSSPGAHVLAVLPGTADVALDDPLIARRLKRLAEGRTHRRVAHPAVHDVHAGRGAPGGHGVHLGLLHLADPLGAEPDNTRLRPCGPISDTPWHVLSSSQTLCCRDVLLRSSCLIATFSFPASPIKAFRANSKERELREALLHSRPLTPSRKTTGVHWRHQAGCGRRQAFRPLIWPLAYADARARRPFI